MCVCVHITMATSYILFRDYHGNHYKKLDDNIIGYQATKCTGSFGTEIV